MKDTAHVRLVPRSEISARISLRFNGVCVLEQRRPVLHVLDHGNLLENQPAVLAAVTRWLYSFRGASGVSS